MKSTTLTIKNEHGEYSVSAPVGVTFDGHLDLFIILMNLSGFNEKTVENGIVEKADELIGEQRSVKRLTKSKKSQPITSRET